MEKVYGVPQTSIVSYETTRMDLRFIIFSLLFPRPTLASEALTKQQKPDDDSKQTCTGR